MQMSRNGLFQALLYTCLQRDEDLAMTAFTERWEQFATFGGGREPVEWPELRRAFQRIISDPSKKFFFIIDGLDEFDGEPKEIIDLVFGAVRPNVKLCITSRPWLPFEDAFKGRPSLLLQDLTKEDISTFVKDRFHKSRDFLRLQRTEPAAAAALLENIVRKASGVFLWVHLVVQSILEGLSNSDRMTDLQTRLDDLPGDLEALFSKMLSRLQPNYFIQACESFRLLRTYWEASRTFTSRRAPSLVALYFAEEQDIASGYKCSLEHMTADEIKQLVRIMRRRLNARSKGLIEVHRHEVCNPEYMDRSIGYLHRTARDFIESENYWPTVLRSTGHASFEPEKRWANSCLWLHKRLPTVYFSDYLLEECLINARIVRDKTGLVQKSYLDEVYRAEYQHEDIEGKQMGRLILTIKSAASYDYMTDYLALMLESATPEELDHAWKNRKLAFLKHQDFALKMLRYYRIPRGLRWLRPKPALVAYE
jgi:hypothetical protein